MEKYDIIAIDLEEGAVTLVEGFAKAFQRVMFGSCPQQVKNVVWVEFQFEACSRPAADNPSDLVRMKSGQWLLCRIVIHEAMSEVLNVYPQLMIRCMWMTSRFTSEARTESCQRLR